MYWGLPKEERDHGLYGFRTGFDEAVEAQAGHDLVADKKVHDENDHQRGEVAHRFHIGRRRPT